MYMEKYHKIDEADELNREEETESIKQMKEGVMFPGYDIYNCQEQFIVYPMILQEYWWALSGSEQKVLDFVIRKTFGWQKQGDYISISQFTDGDGTGGGTGLSRAQVKRAITSLEKRGFIRVERHDHRPSYIELPLSESAKKDVELHGINKGSSSQSVNKQVRGSRNHYSTKEYMKGVVENNKYGF
jgi:Bacteriophage replication protein O